MGVSSGFYNSLNGDRKYTAEQLSSIFDGVIEDGIYAFIYDDTEEDPLPFKVVPTANNMEVTVKKGRAWFKHTWIYNDGDITVDLASPPSTGRTRIDSIIIKIDTNNRVNTIDKLTGIAASSNPVAPTLSTGTNGVYEYAIANILVTSDTTSIDPDSIDQTMIGTDVPYVTSPAKSISISQYLADWETQFNIWVNQRDSEFDDLMANVSGLMTQEQATYLLGLIDNLHMITINIEYDEDNINLVGKYLVCTNGVRTFTATTTNSGSVQFRIGDRRADQSQNLAYDSCLGDWVITLYESSSNDTIIGPTHVINAYYYGNYPTIELTAPDSGGDEPSEFSLNFALTCSGTTYRFLDTSESSSKDGVYKFSRSGNDNWSIHVYTSGTINFTTLTTNVDICTVGGGGGGGGAYANASSASVAAYNGGNGGGGYVTNTYNKEITTGSAYTLTVGARGSAGSGSGSNLSTTTAGGNGGTTSVKLGSTTISTASGGHGGGRATASGGSGSNGSGGSKQYPFGSDVYSYVSGSGSTSRKGSGGYKGEATAYWNSTGSYQMGGNAYKGVAGLIIIRNHRS